jgi:hypothetical protein
MARILWELNEGGDNYAIDAILAKVASKIDINVRVRI